MIIFSGIADEAGSKIEQQIQAHQELGWKYIELRMIDAENIACLDDDKFRQITSKLQEAGILVSCFASKIGDGSRKISGSFEEDLQNLRQAIARMRSLGTQYIRVMSWPNDGWEEKKWKEEVLHRMQELTSLAEEANITLVHENCSGWGSKPETCRRLIETINSPSLKVLYDTGNPSVEGSDSWEFYQAVKDHIAYVHIKDALGRDSSGKGIYTFPGEGAGKVREVLKDIFSSSRDVLVSIEPHLTSVIHAPKMAGKAKDPYQIYLDYGQRLMKIVEEIKS